MEVEELISRAWKAVKEAGVPEPLQELAFKEALATLRHSAEPQKNDEAAGGSTGDTGSNNDQERPKTKAAGSVNELSKESGVRANDITDVIQINGNTVTITVPTKNLGKSVAEQARTAIVLLSSARAHVLNEKPVDAEAVRKELERKHCYQANNFANKHLGPLKGFNAGSNRNQIVLTSKWVDEFVQAINQAHGRSGDAK